MKTLTIFALSILLSFGAAIGQTVISGKVYSKSDGTPISGAVITAKNDPSITVRTDKSGHFTMSISPEVKVIEVAAPGFKTQTQGIGQKTVFVFEMISNDRGNSEGGKTKVSNTQSPASSKGAATDANSGKGVPTNTKTKVGSAKVVKTNDVAK